MVDHKNRYVESLTKIVEANYQSLVKAMDDFQEKCRMVTLERNIPRDIIVDIRQSQKQIRDKCVETKAIEQVLQGRYRQFYRPQPLRVKKITELGLIVKNCYSKVEFTLMQLDAKKRMENMRAPLSANSDQPAQPQEEGQAAKQPEACLETEMALPNP
jgi:hypothetical protein